MLFLGNLLDHHLGLGGRVGLGGQERVADGVGPHPRQLEVHFGPQQLVGNLQQDAGAITSLRIGAGGSPVIEVPQGMQAVRDDFVAGDPAQRGHEGDTAGVVLECRVVEPLGRMRKRTPNRRNSHSVTPVVRPVGRQRVRTTGAGGNGIGSWGDDVGPRWMAQVNARRTASTSSKPT